MGDPIGITYDSGSGGPELTAQEFRQDIAALTEGPAGQAVSGVKHDTGLVTLSGSTITHAAMNFVMQGVTATTGVYLGYEPQATKTLTAAHATLARVDAVWVRVQDNEADSSGQRRSIVEYAAGTAGSSSAGVGGVAGAPAAPSGAYILLATIAVPASGGGSAVVTDRRVFYNPPPAQVVFTSNGTFTKANYPGLKAVRVRLAGGGGAGGAGISTGASQGAAGGGGGGGQTVEAIIPVASLPASVSVTVGAGGTAPAGNGAASTFDTLLTANAGQGGSNLAAPVVNGSAAGGAGGTGSGGSWTSATRWDGEDGDTGRISNSEPQPAEGGASGFNMGAGGRQGVNVTGQITGQAGKTYGGGGAGGANRANVTPGGGGGNGAAGVCIVELIYR